MEAISELRKLPDRSPVYVYREKSKKWEGPFPCIQVGGETAVVQLPSGRKIFRSTVVKPVVRSAFSEYSNGTADPSKDRAAIGEDQCGVMFGSAKVVIAPAEAATQF